MFSFLRHPFKKNIPLKPSVLLVETNGCHGEVIGGYVKYFKDLNYNVYILISKTIYRENPFARQPNENIFVSSPKNFSKLLTSEYLNKYDHIFIMSSVNYDHGEHSVMQLYPDLQKHPSVYYVHHNQKYIDNFYHDTPKNHNIMLGDFKDTVFLNPHLFGKFKLPMKQKQTIFISVGGINPKRKNHELLLSAIEELDKQQLDFMVLIVGSGSLKHLKPNVKKHIKLLGHLDYGDMYDALERAHFFLPLLDSDNPDHERYIKSQVTGSAQLIYGFRKIPVIHQKFAPFYKFDDKNAIIYNQLSEGMKSAIQMSDSDYNEYTKHLNTTAMQIYDTTLNNLKDLLNA